MGHVGKKRTYTYATRAINHVDRSGRVVPHRPPRAYAFPENPQSDPYGFATRQARSDCGPRAVYGFSGRIAGSGVTETAGELGMSLLCDHTWPQGSQR